MRMISMLILGICLVVLVTQITSAFQISTNTYSADKTNTGLSGDEMETNNYEGRMYWEPWQPSSGAETNLYFLDAGYFDAITQTTGAITITLDYPVNNDIINDTSTNFNHTTTSNATIESCNLLVYRNGTLNINQTTNYPGTGNTNWTGGALAEDEYNWSVSCTAGGETSNSPTNTFTIDQTAPSVTINEPLDAITAWEQFEFTIDEPHPDYLIIGINGTNYTYNYTNGTNNYQPNLPLGNYEFNLTVYDSAGNEATLNNNPIYVIDVPVTFSNIAFSPSPIFDDIDNELSIKIGGTFSDVILSVNINGSGWTNYSVNTFTGNGPYTYYKELDEALYNQGEWIAQQWFAKDSINETKNSNILNQTVTKRGGGGGGSFPEDEETSSELPEGLLISPEPLQITNRQGVLFDVKNNATSTCTITDIRVEDRLGSNELQDAFTTKSLSIEEDLTLAPGERLSFQIRPRSFQGIAGVGSVIVESNDCEQIEVPLSVNIHWIDITRDAINNFTDNIISYFRGIIGVL